MQLFPRISPTRFGVDYSGFVAGQPLDTDLVYADEGLMLVGNCLPQQQCVLRSALDGSL